MPRDIKGVNTNPPQSKPRTMGRAIAIQPAETIRPHMAGDGHTVMGTPAANQHGKTTTRYNDAAAKAHRESLRSTPYPGKR